MDDDYSVIDDDHTWDVTVRALLTRESSIIGSPTPLRYIERCGDTIQWFSQTQPIANWEMVDSRLPRRGSGSVPA